MNKTYQISGFILNLTDFHLNKCDFKFLVPKEFFSFFSVFSIAEGPSKENQGKGVGKSRCSFYMPNTHFVEFSVYLNLYKRLKFTYTFNFSLTFKELKEIFKN